jgi:hypothetical protein
VSYFRNYFLLILRKNWNYVYIYIYVCVCVRACLCVTEAASGQIKLPNFNSEYKIFPLNNTFYVSAVHITTTSVAHCKKLTPSSGSNSGSEFRVFCANETPLSLSMDGAAYCVNRLLFGRGFKVYMSFTSSSFKSSSPVRFLY